VREWARFNLLTTGWDLPQSSWAELLTLQHEQRTYGVLRQTDVHYTANRLYLILSSQDTVVTFKAWEWRPQHLCNVAILAKLFQFCIRVWTQFEASYPTSKDSIGRGDKLSRTSWIHGLWTESKSGQREFEPTPSVGILMTFLPCLQYCKKDGTTLSRDACLTDAFFSVS
jgi:hypothetical protein